MDSIVYALVSDLRDSDILICVQSARWKLQCIVSDVHSAILVCCKNIFQPVSSISPRGRSTHLVLPVAI
jgi:hypothetical protein